MLVAGFKAFNLATVGGAGSPWTANPAGSSKARKLQIFEALAELRFQTNLFHVCHGETSRPVVKSDWRSAPCPQFQHFLSDYFDN